MKIKKIPSFCKLSFVRIFTNNERIILLTDGQRTGHGQVRDRSKYNDGRIRCYTCSSTVQANCGDPFFSGRVAAKYCDQYSTNSVHMCFKSVKWCKFFPKV